MKVNITCDVLNTLEGVDSESCVGIYISSIIPEVEILCKYV